MSGDLALEPIEDLDGWREEWTRLAETTGHPFATWEWNSTWWRHFNDGKPLYAFAARDGAGKVRAILPMYEAVQRPLRVARFLGYADLQSPLCAPEDRPSAAAALRAAVRRPHRCRVLFAERLPSDAGWGALMSGSRIHSYAAPILRFRGREWDEVMKANLNGKHRSTLRRKERKLIAEHGLEYRLASDPDRLPDDMRTLFRLHDSRWGPESTGIFGGAGGDFHIDFARAALESGMLRLWFAELEGKPAAAWYGFRYAGVDWHLQSGRDPQFDRLSVGMALFVHTLRSACEDGMTAYHFLLGDESYKMHFAEDNAGAESWLLGARPMTAAVGAAVRLRGAVLGARARRRVERAQTESEANSS